ncbi:hypothetical protein NJB95_07485 [Brucella intermedia]|uniref:hypothetical protein n=1 Tax=Brucella intermedia TaxID=94625 RepID=UPI00209A896A|nr:hypothetical protein [Brucella intermedia]MCO7736452.1 hypothetical protein [Brucella intermedia]
MTEWVGIKFVLDLDACFYLSGAGNNLKGAVFARAKQDRTAVTSEVFKKVKQLDPDLAAEMLASGIEVVDLDQKIYDIAENITKFLSVSITLQKVANEKIPVMALVHGAQNGVKPPCTLVTADYGQHSSSMPSLCEKMGMPWSPIDQVY